ncbi:MAG TPA: ribonuclease domain-containing protein [Amycolatopsis sp.]|uniref:ribonuclease domain-containing protein n=1 Tax=Amycolatopsis sp. TaxID=37632 RepID=UPI002B49C55A|nr:ribonuclease domain-containing protein [Amycolatopsis sp.]HKS47788.1 ribonuclease domain-containing protein [Amycolatopsis sp.]
MKQATSRRRITAALVGLIVLVLGGWLVRDVIETRVSAPQTQALSTLPPETATTYRLIQAGGPFPYPGSDGTVFENREKRLPQKPSGYYHEYTVPTPGSADRGPRRLITGDGRELYYTGDHYQSFVVVDPAK